VPHVDSSLVVIVCAESRPPHAEPKHGHGEDGRIEPTIDFDYDAIDRSVFEIDWENVSGADLEASSKVFKAMVGWVWQDGMRNPEGMNIRSIIVCWVFLDHLRPLTLTELSRAFGKKKQSLGRWVDDFKRAFPDIRNPHMKD